MKNQLKKLINLLNSTPNTDKTNNRRKRKWKKNDTPYNISTRPVRYGPGRNISVINSNQQFSGNTSTRIPLQTLLLSNSEFTAKKSFFRYFKILEVRVCFYPSGINDSGIIYINLSWNAITYSTEDIIKDDSTKVVTGYRTRTKVYRWLPIRSVINVNSISEEVPTNFLDVSQFISTDRVVSLPGWLYIINQGSFTVANIEVKVLFRSNDFGTVAKKPMTEDVFKVKVEAIKPTFLFRDLVDDSRNIKDEEKIQSEEEEEVKEYIIPKFSK